MKRSFKLMGILLLLIIAGNGSLMAQRGMRGMMDTTGMNRPGRGMDMRQMRGMRGMDGRPDSMRMNMMRGMGQQGDSLHMRGMRNGMGRMDHPAGFRMNRMDMFAGPGRMHGMRGMYQMDPLHRMGRPMHQGMRGTGPLAGPGMNRMDRMGQGQMGPAMMMLESIPNVTEKQKKEITDLRKKQQDEMTKFREDMSLKMKVMREANKAKMMEILTPEQKKFLESKQVITTPPPVKTK